MQAIQTLLDDFADFDATRLYTVKEDVEQRITDAINADIKVNAWMLVKRCSKGTPSWRRSAGRVEPRRPRGSSSSRALWTGATLTT